MTPFSINTLIVNEVKIFQVQRLCGLRVAFVWQEMCIFKANKREFISVSRDRVQVNESQLSCAWLKEWLWGGGGWGKVFVYTCHCIVTLHPIAQSVQWLGYGLYDRGYFSGSGKHCISSPRLWPDQFWGPPSFLSTGYRDLIRANISAGAWSWPLTSI
jgi:hypothetical protein